VGRVVVGANSGQGVLPRGRGRIDISALVKRMRRGIDSAWTKGVQARVPVLPGPDASGEGADGDEAEFFVELYRRGVF
jgi:hypothetical protein